MIVRPARIDPASGVAVRACSPVPRWHSVHAAWRRPEVRTGRPVRGGRTAQQEELQTSDVRQTEGYPSRYSPSRMVQGCVSQHTHVSATHLRQRHSLFARARPQHCARLTSRPRGGAPDPWAQFAPSALLGLCLLVEPAQECAAEQLAQKRREFLRPDWSPFRLNNSTKQRVPSVLRTGWVDLNYFHPVASSFWS